MKKFFKILFLALTVSVFAAVKSHAQQLEVSVRPEVPREYAVASRPPQPSPAYAWVEPEWTIYAGRYRYEHGYWKIPPPGYRHWQPGHWINTPRGGQIWVKGYWY